MSNLVFHSRRSCIGRSPASLDLWLFQFFFPCRSELEWLKTCDRRKYFLGCLTFRILNTQRPLNLYQALSRQLYRYADRHTFNHFQSIFQLRVPSPTITHFQLLRLNSGLCSRVMSLMLPVFTSFLIIFLRWLERSSRPKAMNIFYKNSFTHSNLETDIAEAGFLTYQKRFLIENFQFCKSKFCPLKKIQ